MESGAVAPCVCAEIVPSMHKKSETVDSDGILKLSQIKTSDPIQPLAFGLLWSHVPCTMYPPGQDEARPQSKIPCTPTRRAAHVNQVMIIICNKLLPASYGREGLQLKRGNSTVRQIGPKLVENFMEMTRQPESETRPSDIFI